MHVLQVYNEQSGSGYGSFPQLGHPILYDPVTRKSQWRKRSGAGMKMGDQTGSLLPADATKVPEQKLNEATIGSVLRVWSGKLDLLAHMNKSHNGQSTARKYSQTVDVEFFSTQDIRAFQACPDWPATTKSGHGSLPLRGKAEVLEVMKHCQARHKEQKPMRKGYIIMPEQMDAKERAKKGLQSSQQNSNNFSAHFNELKSQQKCSLFTLYNSLKARDGSLIKEVHLYLLPISSLTLTFCQDMGLLPVAFSGHLERQAHMFAYLVNLSKHPTYTLIEKMSLGKSGLPSLNPEAVLSKEAMEARAPRMPVVQGHSYLPNGANVDSIVKSEQHAPFG